MGFLEFLLTFKLRGFFIYYINLYVCKSSYAIMARKIKKLIQFGRNIICTTIQLLFAKIGE